MSPALVFDGIVPCVALLYVRIILRHCNDDRCFDLRFGKSSIYNPKVQECDARKVQ